MGTKEDPGFILVGHQEKLTFKQQNSNTIKLSLIFLSFTAKLPVIYTVDCFLDGLIHFFLSKNLHFNIGEEGNQKPFTSVIMFFFSIVNQ